MIMDYNWKAATSSCRGSDRLQASTTLRGYDRLWRRLRCCKGCAESLLLNSDKAYAFVTDQVNGYLFVDAQSGGTTSDAAIEMGIILVGLTSESDFEWTNVWTSMWVSVRVGSKLRLSKCFPVCPPRRELRPAVYEYTP